MALIAFPKETAVGEVPATKIFNLGMVYGTLVLIIWLGAIYAINRYNISRAQYSKTVSRLKEM